MMRNVLGLATLSLLCGCQQQVTVPTAQQLADNPKLLDEWRAKCGTGEYSHLAATEKANLCTSTDQAVATVALRKSSNADADFFDSISKRK